MMIMLPKFTGRSKRRAQRTRRVFRMFKRLDNGRFMIVGWVTKYPSSPVQAEQEQ